MSKVKFSDVVNNIKVNIDREHNPYNHYIAGDHMDTEDIHLRRKGSFETDDVGPAFTRLFKIGQILYGSRRTYLKKAAIADFEGITANTTFVFESRDESIFLTKLLPFLIQSNSFTEWSVKKSKGSTNPYVVFSDLANFEFELPELKIQKEYEDILWKIDNTREAYRNLISSLDKLNKSRFIELFGDLNTNPFGFEVKKLSEIAEYYNGVTYKPENIVDSKSGFLVLRSSNIQNGQIAFDDNVYINMNIKDKHKVEDNDILMCSRNGSAKLVGKVALIHDCPKDTCFGAFMMIIRSKFFNYLYSYFQSTYFRQRLVVGATSTINQITVSMLDNIKLPIPPIELVNKYTEQVKQIDKSKFNLKRAIHELDLLTEKITSRLFCLND